MTTPALARPSMPVSLTDLAPISLADLSAQAELLTRVDRKYVVPTSVLPSGSSASRPEPGSWRSMDAATSLTGPATGTPTSSTAS